MQAHDSQVVDVLIMVHMLSKRAESGRPEYERISWEPTGNRKIHSKSDLLNKSGKNVKSFVRSHSEDSVDYNWIGYGRR